jgi:hypothetical protein
MPRLKDGGTSVRFESSGRAVVSAGPTIKQAEAHRIDGKFGTPKVTLELKSPRGEPVLAVHAAAHVFSSSPPRSDVKYQIEFSTDAGKSWQPLVKDWTVNRQGDEPKDFWSQSLCWGTRELAMPVTGPIQFRFRNDGGKAFARCEAHLTYAVEKRDASLVRFAWSDDSGPHEKAHVVPAAGKGDDAVWHLPTGKGVQTHWVEFEQVTPH